MGISWVVVKATNYDSTSGEVLLHGDTRGGPYRGLTDLPGIARRFQPIDGIVIGELENLLEAIATVPKDAFAGSEYGGCNIDNNTVFRYRLFFSEGSAHDWLASEEGNSWLRDAAAYNLVRLI